ncbi:UDP-Glycosyltransferase/glycogen phosphorylase [Gymnopus androsaceus JB14]|uniref:sterol 3beta-glucosyltransferase n=1 Tax=Gymnopus androsaceus JB14 TaxID=1447944 RepID=A0A6A4HZS7_9AGAR|nr:UDP-Glycosyltransferase/glycogen phosphorylase [Gymnopus androsaceus JB14]
MSDSSQTMYDSTDADSDEFLPFIGHIRRDANEFDKVLRDDSSILDGFNELVAKDLDSEEQAAVGRDARLDVASVREGFLAGTAWTDADLTSEPESFTSESDTSSIINPEFHRSATMDGDRWKLEPDELGVLHLTTHRLTFHASLLSARPDLPPSQQIIKAGPFTVRRTHHKRRLWLELTHDMLCAYASSSADDHMRPLRSILLSSIRQMTAIDSRAFQLICGDNLDISGIIEFDTEESAHEWRKEVSGAIFLQRHRRHEAIGSDFSDASSGIRLQLSRSCTVPLGPVENDISSWLDLEKYIQTAKRRASTAPTPSEAPVVIDLGPLTFTQDVKSSTTPPMDARSRCYGLLLVWEANPKCVTRAHISRKITCLGYFIVSPNYVGFWGKFLVKSVNDVRYRLPIRTIKSASPISGKFFKTHGLALEVEGQHDLKFHFKTQDLRDEAIQQIESWRALVSSLTATTPSSSATAFISTPDSWPIINLNSDALISRPSLHFVCLTIGSRGDVQPYIALGLGLKKENHTVTIVTHEEYREWIEGFGLNFKQAGGDPGALMKLSVENKMFSPEFFKESLSNFRGWLDQLLLDAWESCQGADVLLESPSAMAGVHIAEALQIPYFRCFTMPWTKTREFPHAFLSPPVDSPTFNSASNVIWVATSGQINRWRRNTLKIGNTDMGHLAQSKIVFIYNFSQAVVPRPLDWGDSISISGYWFLDNPDLNWNPPSTLTAWMEKARVDGKPIVYIGFGSITVPHPNRVTSRIIEAVLKSDVRAIISKGWSARMSKSDDEKDPEPVMPPECYPLDQVPHDWLFPQIDAALHHGGAGTTGASLRAGIPTLIKPWFGDQFFWASRIQKLGAGLKVSSLRVNELADALTKATTNRIMKEKAAGVGERIRSEDGVRTAIRTLYTYLPRASRDRTLLT